MIVGSLSLVKNNGVTYHLLSNCFLKSKGLLNQFGDPYLDTLVSCK